MDDMEGDDEVEKFRFVVWHGIAILRFTSVRNLSRLLNPLKKEAEVLYNRVAVENRRDDAV